MGDITPGPVPKGQIVLTAFARNDTAFAINESAFASIASFERPASFAVLQSLTLVPHFLALNLKYPFCHLSFVTETLHPNHSTT